MAIRSNREILTGGKKYHQKQIKKYGVEEVVFDKAAREDFLTGFHKRKVERQKKAQAYHKEQERKARVEERKQLREEEKKKFEEQLEQLRELRELLSKYELGFEDDETPNGKSKKLEEKSDEDEWTGFTEETGKEESLADDDDEEPVKGILQKKEVYKFDRNSNDGNLVVDGETEVVIESLENPHIAAITNRSIEALAKANNVNLDKSEEVLEDSIQRAKNYAKLCGVEKPKQKKKKFRYLTKAERRENNRKQKVSKLKSRKQALQKK